ncbi:MAG TPA: hypothetical protein VGS41_15760, partial [Chthonomonadales bacterium]|nr:hypothetical protein [Chthonomonadales bacterium]
MLDTGPHAVDISLIVETAGGERVRETVLAALNSLQKKGLAFIVENRAVFPEWAHEVWGSISRSFTLRRCLGGYDSTDLGRVCESLGLSVAERSRSAIVEQVAQYLTSLATSGRIYDILDEDAAGALSLL